MHTHNTFLAQIGVSLELICRVTLTITDTYALSNSSSLNFTVRLPPFAACSH